MGQIIGSAAKPQRCNLNKLSQLETPAAGEHILVSSDNSMNAAGQGNFDCYIIGDGSTAATSLPLHTIADDILLSGSRNAVSGGAVFTALANKSGYSKSIGFTLTAGQHVTFDAITLSQDGDSIEFDVATAITGAGNYGGYNFHKASRLGVSYSNTQMTVRADNGTWVASYIGVAATASSDWKHIKVAYENGNLVAYVNGVSKYSGAHNSNVVTLTGIGGINTDYPYWAGSVKNYKYTHNGVTTDLFNFTNLVIDSGAALITLDDPFVRQSEIVDALTSDDATKPLSAKQGKVLKGLLESAGGEYDSVISSLGGWAFKFNGTSSKLTFQAPIVLSANGDYIEFGVSSCNATSLNAGGYGFATKGAGVRVGYAPPYLYVRADDNTWLFQRTSARPQSSFKIEFSSGNVLLYIDGTVVETYTGQKTITIENMGYGDPTYGYWGGIVDYVKTDDGYIDLLSEPSAVDIEQYRADYFLTDEQADTLKNASSQMYAKKEENTLSVYMKAADNSFIRYSLAKRVEAYASGAYPSFYDNWGLERPYSCELVGASMTAGTPIFSFGEAELAVSVPDGNNTNTYVGGAAHGFENIVNGTDGREICILVDNQKIGETDTFDLKSVQKVEIIQHTQLYQAYTNSNPFANVQKHWLFENGKLQISPKLTLLRQITFALSQFGMMCVYRHVGGNANNQYITNRAIKNNIPYKVYDVSDGWNIPSLESPDYDCTKVTEYGEIGVGVSLEVLDSNKKASGGMFITTNNGVYNKIYFDMGRNFTANEGDVLYATVEWGIYKDRVSE